MESFKFNINDYFKLSTGTVALVGVMVPGDYPIVTSEKYVVEIKTQSGKSLRLNKINEDIFSRSEPTEDYSRRSFQTFEDISSFIENMAIDPIYLQGYPKING
jgi:uncharacterized protein YaiE (UPF0345 family)